MPGSPLLAVCSRKWQVPETMQIWGKEALTEGPGGGKFRPQGTSQMALVVKNLPATAGDVRDRVPPRGRQHSLEKEMATHSRILAWRIPWTEEAGGLQSMGLQRLGFD